MAAMQAGHFTCQFWRMAAMQAGQKACRELVARAREVDNIVDLLRRDFGGVFALENNRAFAAIGHGAQ